jgi:hypothetical protein
VAIPVTTNPRAYQRKCGPRNRTLLLTPRTSLRTATNTTLSTRTFPARTSPPRDSQLARTSRLVATSSCLTTHDPQLQYGTLAILATGYQVWNSNKPYQEYSRAHRTSRLAATSSCLAATSLRLATSVWNPSKPRDPLASMEPY